MSTLVPLREQLNPLQDAFNLFMLTMPRQKLNELVQYVNSPEAEQVRSQVQHGRHSSVASGASTSRAAARRRGRGRQLRPLNSFIAFRSFYSTMFPELTQKAKSGILRFLWQNDPFKAKWAILAKAYSKIRDEHAGSIGVCLETFLNLNASYIGILEPSLYLETMGWELTVDENNQYTMAKVSHETVNESDISTNLSVNDVVNHCYDTGYVSRGGRQERENHNEPVMSFVAQPRPIVNEGSNIQVTETNTVIENSEDAGAPESDGEERVEDTPTPAFSDASSAFEGSSSIPVEAPAEQNHVQATANAGAGLDLDLLGGSIVDNTDLLPFDNSTFEFEGETMQNVTMGPFDFNHFVEF